MPSHNQNGFSKYFVKVMKSLSYISVAGMIFYSGMRFHDSSAIKLISRNNELISVENSDLFNSTYRFTYYKKHSRQMESGLELKIRFADDSLFIDGYRSQSKFENGDSIKINEMRHYKGSIPVSDTSSYSLQ